MSDVLIAGGGIAGSALAIVLGRQGIATQLFERRRFPHDKPCGEGLMPAGVAALERLGLDIPGAPFHGIRYHAGSLSVTGRFPVLPGLPATGRGLRRLLLDQALFDAAAAAGAQTWPGVTVQAPIVEHGRVRGLIVDGAPVKAPLVVVADGLRSPLRRQLGLDAPAARRRRIGLRTHFRLAPGQAQPPWVEVFLGDGYELYVTPLPNQELLVAGLAEATAVQGGAEASFTRWLQDQPLLLRRLEGAQRISELQGRFPLRSSARAGCVPGAVLLGDAAGFLDPITGGGMAQALLSAELLARHIAGFLAGDQQVLAHFEQQRQRMLRDYQRVTLLVLALASRPLLARLALRLLGASPRLFSHLLGVAGSSKRLL